MNTSTNTQAETLALIETTLETVKDKDTSPNSNAHAHAHANMTNTILDRVNSKFRGFTMIEVVVASTIFMIVSATSIIGYQHYTSKARRLEAHITLINLIAQAEQYYLKNNAYPAKMIELADPNSKYYLYEGKTCGAGCMEIIATAIPGTLQAKDSECSVLTINTHGDKTPATPSRCWAR